MINIKNLSLNLSSKKILKNINFTAKNGEILTIIGPNGSGKSSLLKCLTGLKNSYQGEIYYDEENIKNFGIKELAQKRAVLSQGSAINFPFTSIDIIKMGRSSCQTSEKTNQIIIDELIKKLQIEDLVKAVFSNLSGGQQQLIHIARVLAQIWDKKNAYLFLDEPLAALDLKYQHNFLKLISEICKEKNLAIIIIIHDLNLAKIYANKAILLKNGQLKYFGTNKKIITKKNISEIFEIDKNLIF